MILGTLKLSGWDLLKWLRQIKSSTNTMFNSKSLGNVCPHKLGMLIQLTVYRGEKWLYHIELYNGAWSSSLHEIKQLYTCIPSPHPIQVSYTTIMHHFRLLYQMFKHSSPFIPTLSQKYIWNVTKRHATYVKTFVDLTYDNRYCISGPFFQSLHCQCFGQMFAAFEWIIWYLIIKI